VPSLHKIQETANFCVVCRADSIYPLWPDSAVTAVMPCCDSGNRRSSRTLRPHCALRSNLSCYGQRDTMGAIAHESLGNPYLPARSFQRSRRAFRCTPKLVPATAPLQECVGSFIMPDCHLKSILMSWAGLFFMSVTFPSSRSNSKPTVHGSSVGATARSPGGTSRLSTEKNLAQAL